MNGVYDGPTTVVARTLGSWAKGKSIEEALKGIRKVSGVRSMQKTLIDVFIGGTPEQHEEIGVLSDGSTKWPGTDADGNEVQLVKVGGAMTKEYKS